MTRTASRKNNHLGDEETDFTIGQAMQAMMTPTIVNLA